MWTNFRLADNSSTETARLPSRLLFSPPRRDTEHGSGLPAGSARIAERPNISTAVGGLCGTGQQEIPSYSGGCWRPQILPFKQRRNATMSRFSADDRLRGRISESSARLRLPPRS